MNTHSAYQPVPPVISLNGLGLSLGQRVVLAQVDLQLPQTGVDVLMGPPGCGKSLLLRALACELPVHEQAHGQVVRQWGQMQLQGLAISPQWRPAWVGQDFKPPAGSLLQALLTPGPSLPLHANLHERRLAAAQRLGSCGLGALVALLDKPLAQLPRSHQLAACILGQSLAAPQLMMIDEPTQGLEENEALWLITWLAALGRRTRLLVVLHHQGHARRLGERIVLLGGGRVLAHESTARFFQYPPNEWAQQFVRTGGMSIASPRRLLEPSDGSHKPLGEAPAKPSALSEYSSGAGSVDDAEPSQPPAAGLQVSRKAWPLSQHGAAEDAPLVPSGRFELLPGSWRKKEPPLAGQGAITPKLSGADFSDTMPGARLGMAPKFSGPTFLPMAKPAAKVTPAGPVPPQQLAGVDFRLPLTPDEGADPGASAGPSLNPNATQIQDWVGELGTGPEGFHWVQPGALAGCATPGKIHLLEYDLRLLAQAGIQVLVSLCEEGCVPVQALARHGLQSLHLPVFGRQALSLAHLERLAARVQIRLHSGQALALHCAHGQEHTGTALAAWMICTQGLSAEQALARLRTMHPGYGGPPAQGALLQRLQAALKNARAGP